MRLKIQETLEALRDSIKAGSKDGPKIALTNASDMPGKPRPGDSPLSPTCETGKEGDASAAGEYDVSSIQSSRQGTMPRMSDMARPGRGSTGDATADEKEVGSKMVAAEGEDEDDAYEQPSQTSGMSTHRRLTTEHKSSHKLYAKRVSQSVPEMAVSDSVEVSEKGTEMGTMGSNEGVDSVAELSHPQQRRASGMSPVSTIGVNGGGLHTGTVPTSWKGPVSAGESGPAPVRSRRSSSGLFFKPGFSKTEAWQGLGEVPGENLNSDGQQSGAKVQFVGDAEKTQGLLNASDDDEHLDEISPRLSGTDNPVSPASEAATEESEQAVKTRGPNDRPYSFVPASASDAEASFQMPSILHMAMLDDYTETAHRDSASSHRLDERSLPIRLSRSLRVSVARKSVTGGGVGSINTSAIGSQDSLLLSKSFSTLSVQSGPRHSSVASLIARRPEVPSIGFLVVTEQQREKLKGAVDHDLLAALDVRDGQRLMLDATPGEGRRSVAAPAFVDFRPDAPTSTTLVTETVNGKVMVVSARLQELVQLLASEGYTDAEYIVDFLTTYRYFADPTDVARLLIMRYIIVGMGMTNDAKPGKEAEEEEEVGNVSESLADFLSYLKKADPAKKPSGGATSGRKDSKQYAPAEDWTRFLQLKILNVFKKWIELYPLDFDQSRELFQLTVLFLSKHVEPDSTRTVFASAMLQNLHEKLEAYRAHESLPSSPSQLLVPSFQSPVAPGLPLPLKGLMHGASEPNLGSLTSRRGSADGSVSASIGDFVATRASRLPGGAPTLGRASSSLTLDTTIRSKQKNLGASAAHGIASPAGDGPLIPSLAGAFSFDTLSPKSASHTRASTSPANLEAQQVSMPDISDAGHTRHPLSAGVADTPGTTDMNADALAQQLTLIEHGYFSRIQVPEMFFQSWNDRQYKQALAPNLIALITWFNRIAYGVATQVVSQPLLRSRVTCIKRFIYIAQLCFSWGNFNTLFEIVAGLNLAPVTRLKRTWKALPKKYWEVWNQLNLIVSNENSYKTYRIALRSLQTTAYPILPYLGVNLSDLTFAEDGNPSFLSPPASAASAGKAQMSTINFTKFQMISSLIRSIVGLQARGLYSFSPDPKLQAFLMTEWPVLDDAELYEHSKVAEPKQAG